MQPKASGLQWAPAQFGKQEGQASLSLDSTAGNCHLLHRKSLHTSVDSSIHFLNNPSFWGVRVSLLSSLLLPSISRTMTRRRPPNPLAHGQYLCTTPGRTTGAPPSYTASTSPSSSPSRSTSSAAGLLLAALCLTLLPLAEPLLKYYPSLAGQSPACDCLLLLTLLAFAVSTTTKGPPLLCKCSGLTAPWLMPLLLIFCC